MAYNTCVVNGNDEKAYKFFDMLKSKQNPVMICASSTVDAIKQIRNILLQYLESRLSLVIHGLSDMSKDHALSFEALFLEDVCKNISTVIFVVELCDGFDAFKAVLDPPMNLRYLTGEE